MTNRASQGQNVFSLSLNQLNIWALEKSVPGTSINNISSTIRIQGRVDFVLLQQAVNLVLEADASLRTRIILHGNEPVQYHADFEALSLSLLDFSSADEESFSHWINVSSQTPIFAYDAPLYRFVMCRMGEGSAVLLVQTHHIISDGWTQVMLCNRIGQTYLDLLEGKQPEFDEFPDYADYVSDEQSYLASASFEDDKAFWRSSLSQAGEAASLRGIRSSSVSHVGRRKSFHLSQQLNHAIYAFCREHRVAPFAVFYMALATYLQRSGNGDCFTIGVPVFNRTTYQYKQTTGMFVSTLPFFGEIDGDWSFNSFSEQFSMQWFDMLRHQRFPFSEIEQMNESSAPLFRIMLSYQDSQMLESPNASVRISGTWHYSGYQAEQLCIHLTNLEDNRVYAVDYDYLAQVFSQRDIEELHQYLCHILLAGLQSPDTPIRALPLLSAEERERVLYGFNQHYAPRYGETPYELLQSVAQSKPRQVAVIYNGERITYETLLQRSSVVAAALGEQQQLVAVLLPRDPRLYAAMLGIMQANCAWLLLSPDQPTARINEILSQSGADVLISTPVLSAPFADCGTVIVDIDSLSAVSHEVSPGKSNDLAYVVYTSGSTGVPKGVEITQQSLVNLAMAMKPIYNGGAVLSLCSVGFDAFVLESIAPMLCGCTVLLASEQQKERPDELADLIKNYGLDYLSTTPSRLSALLDSPRFSIAVRRLQTIICGGEMFPAELLQRLKSCTAARIYNQYGPSETTVAVSMARLDTASQITVGQPMDNCHLYVLDDSLQPLPVNVCGELYVGGICVGHGYRHAPELTAEVFLPSPFISGETLYKTGDSACWTENGELLLSGRRDDQVKIRGLRIELQEISRCFCRHSGISSAVARVLEHCGQQIIVAYYVSEKQFPELELLSFVASYLPGYMVPSRVIRVDSIPLTRNGKADLSKLPEPSEEETSAPAANDVENEILEIFRTVLHTSSLYADSNYFLSGGNSLNAMETISLLEKRFDVHLRVSDLYVCRSARNLASFLSLGTVSVANAPIASAPKREFYPLSETQKSLYLQSCLDENGFAYHMPCAFRFEKKPDVQKLENAFRALIADDAIFRTRFLLRAGDVVAAVDDSVDFSLQRLNAPNLQSAFDSFLQPFDFSAAPLLRAALWEDASSTFYLLVDIHHIIGDGQSTPMILNRLNAFYCGEMPASHLTLHDYSVYCAEHRTENTPILNFWKNTLEGCPEYLELPADKIRPQRFSFCGATETVTLSEKVSLEADRFCTEHELTPYMFFSGVLCILFARLSGQNDIVIGSPVSGRTRLELQNVCGPLMGTLPLRIQQKSNINSYFSSVKDAVLAMLDHAEISLEEIIMALDLPRSLERNPLYQVLFQVRPLDVSSFRIGESSLEYIPIPTGTAKLDLNIEAGKVGSCWQFSMEYASDIFNAETISFYGRCIEALIASLSCAEPNCELSALNALSTVDRIRSIERPSMIRCFCPYMTVTEVIAEETMLHPDHIAIVWHDQRLTYRELETRACHIAGVLRQNGAVPGDRIGLVCRRTPDMIAALLAILRCGCAYVPFLYDYPAARIAYMMETADVRLILCDGEGNNLLSKQALVRPLVDLNSTAEPDDTLCSCRGTDPMYVLFTSGSTGKPKGVQVPHRALINLLENMRVWMRGEAGPYLCSTNMTFDIFITESLLALAQGFGMVLADDEEMLLPWKLAELITAHRPTMVQFTPSRLQMCLENHAFAEAISNISFAIVAGENMPSSLVHRFHTFCPGRLVNMYGPTEAAVYVTAGELHDNEIVTIGRPLQNCRIYVLDENRKPVLPTACGELYIAGQCLSDGYISRPDLTAERYFDDPLFSGEKMYRSGDLGRLRMDGTIECIGRVDAQVKINGNRVELGEISEILLAAGAKQCAVFSRKNADGSDTLVAAAAPDTLCVSVLKKQLFAALPSFMVPSLFYLLPELPQNASGKIDLRAVKNMVETLPAAEETSPAAESPAAAKVKEEVIAVPSQPITAEFLDSEMLISIWKEALKRSDLRPDVSFFEQGGTSLSALHILSEYYNRGIQMTLAEFYRAPSATAQAQLLRARDNAPQPPVITIPQSNVPVIAKPMQQMSVSAASKSVILLTGATGFLGTHLLRQFLEKSKSPIVCLLRDGSKERLQQSLAWYFGGAWVNDNAARIEVIAGDVCKEHFGLTDDTYKDLLSRISVVCHAAADVRHYAADSSLSDTNILGTEHVVRFAAEASAELLHISTASVSGDSVVSAPDAFHVFSESDMDIGQNWNDNLYVRSKFLAEQKVLDAVKGGLHARIMRIGRLIGRSSDGVFQCNPESNAFYLVVQAVKSLNALPSSLAEVPVELSPVDVCAQAVVTLCHAQYGTYHVVEPKPLPLGTVLQKLLPAFEILPDEEFVLRLNEAASEDPSALAPLVDLWNSRNAGPHNVAVSSEKTHLILRSFGFRWPEDIGCALDRF